MKEIFYPLVFSQIIQRTAKKAHEFARFKSMKAQPKKKRWQRRKNVLKLRSLKNIEKIDDVPMKVSVAKIFLVKNQHSCSE